MGYVITDPDQNDSEVRQPDVWVSNEGSIFLFYPRTEAAAEWFENNVQDDAQYHGKSLVVEHRYVDSIVQGLNESGLTAG